MGNLTISQIAEIYSKISVEIREIEEFCIKLSEKTGIKIIFNFDGEIGFGRNCVGILVKNEDCYLAYTSEIDFAPPHSYHKGNYISVLCNEIGYIEATKELHLWIKNIKYFDKLQIIPIKIKGSFCNTEHYLTTLSPELVKKEYSRFD